MKIAISASGPTLDDNVDPRFGRCRYFIILNPETMEFEAVDNLSAMSSGGAGISAAQVIANRGVDVLMTGNCGPNAYQVLSPAGIQVITGVSQKVRDVVAGYKRGSYTAVQKASVPGHYGMGGRSDMRGGFRRGCGSGMGRRRGP